MMDDGPFVANIQFHAAVLISQEIAGLGGPDSAGLPFGPPLPPLPPVLQASWTANCT